MWSANRSHASAYLAQREAQMTPPVVAIVGYSNSGKMRVAAALVEDLTRQGYRVAAVKHCHDGHSLDRIDSDTDPPV